MSKIHVMDEVLANKIAAGEVVEKCMNVVKELVENSIDANADEITIKLIDSGVKEIEVSDNGIGMDREDVAEVFLEVAEEVVPLRRIVSLKGFPHLAGTHPVPVCAGGAPWAGGFCIAQQSHGVILVVVDVEPERDRRFRPHIREGRRRNGQQEQGGE